MNQVISSKKKTIVKINYLNNNINYNNNNYNKQCQIRIHKPLSFAFFLMWKIALKLSMSKKPSKF